MLINKEKLKHLAELAKIDLSEEELEKFLEDLNNILNYVDEIKDLNLDQFEPMIGGVVQKLELREDEVEIENDETKTLIIDQFPDKKENYLKISKIIKKY
jgi:aspartyl-tRNA(Asn)/glutamyl-tRNA(Gln) amidotransferase subunit C